MTIGIILAAGSGTRFGKKSKLFVDLCGQRVIDYPINLCKKLNLSSINLVVKDKSQFQDEQYDLYEQSNDQKGTGAAVKAMISEELSENVLILLGDCPLVDESVIRAALNKLKESDLVIGGVPSKGKHSYGRIKCEGDEVVAIEEASVYKNETPFRNAGWMLCKGKHFHKLLSEIPLIHGEYYLTECVRIAHQSGLKVRMVESKCDIGINTQKDYCDVVEKLQNKWRSAALEKGVSMLDPSSVYFSYDTIVEADVRINPHVVFKRGVMIKSGTEIQSFSQIEDSCIGEDCIVGPFANIRSGTVLGQNVQIGSFVETKNSKFSNGSKAKHLSYVGDAEIGAGSNVGAGVVFCNYDGKNKNKSVVGDNSLLGANSSYVAPIVIGNDVQVGAGSVITKDVKSQCLAVTRAEQKQYRRKI